MFERSEHRLREYFAPANQAVLTAAPAAEAFVPCPCSFAPVHPSHQMFVTEVYRLAREMTEAQLRKPARSFPPEFSLN